MASIGARIMQASGMNRREPKAIRAAWGPLPAVVITADHGDEVRESVRQAGVPIVRKPIRPAGLRAALNQLLSVARKAG